MIIIIIIIIIIITRRKNASLYETFIQKASDLD